MIEPKVTNPEGVLQGLAATGACVLVTGAAGFIASHVTQALLARGVRVVGVDNFDRFYSREDKLRNWREATASAHPALHELVEADICNAGEMRALFARLRPHGVLHLAGKAGVRPSIADPAGYLHANATGTAVVLHEATRSGCTRVVVASSSSVYGNPGTGGAFHEEMDVNRPISPYAASKRATELLAFAHHATTGLPIGLLRFFTVFGPRQRPDLAIMGFMRRIASGQAIEMFGDGSTARDYTFVDDTVSGVLGAYARTPQFGCRVWNLGNNMPITLRDMIAGVAQVVGKPASIEQKPMQAGDVERTCADISRAQSELGYQPRTRFEDGLRAQWQWLRGSIEGVGSGATARTTGSTN
jgi:nucleoside-diphosphate-sugar epimerase